MWLPHIPCHKLTVIAKRVGQTSKVISTNRYPEFQVKNKQNQKVSLYNYIYEYMYDNSFQANVNKQTESTP